MSQDWVVCQSRYWWLGQGYSDPTIDRASGVVAMYWYILQVIHLFHLSSPSTHSYFGFSLYVKNYECFITRLQASLLCLCYFVIFWTWNLVSYRRRMMFYCNSSNIDKSSDCSGLKFWCAGADEVSKQRSRWDKHSQFQSCWDKHSQPIESATSSSKWVSNIELCLSIYFNPEELDHRCEMMVHSNWMWKIWVEIKSFYQVMEDFTESYHWCLCCIFE